MSGVCRGEYGRALSRWGPHGPDCVGNRARIRRGVDIKSACADFGANAHEEMSVAGATARTMVDEGYPRPDASAVLRQNQTVTTVKAVLSRRQHRAVDSAQGGEEQEEADETRGADCHIVFGRIMHCFYSSDFRACG